MSLVSTYVLFDDGRFYRNPTIRGETWFLCFDDNDPPELVVAIRKGEERQGTLERATGILKTNGIEATVVKEPLAEGDRCYATGKRFRKSRSYFLQITSPPPRGLLPRHFFGVEQPKAPCAIELCGGAREQIGAHLPDVIAENLF